jgi:NO-binding membrane sensor protein with MHYT domain
VVQLNLAEISSHFCERLRKLRICSRKGLFATMDASNGTATAIFLPRSLVCHYNPSMVVAALVVSLLGAFTSTQLMTQARSARTLPGVLIWTGLGCLTFGFCGTWCLHFLGMLSCEFDVPIGLDLPLTILSAVCAVLFTFGALSTELILKYWRRPSRQRVDLERRLPLYHHLGPSLEVRQSLEPLLRPSIELPGTQPHRLVARDTINRLENDHSQAEALNPAISSANADTGTAHTSSQQVEGHQINGDSSRQSVLTFSHINPSDYDVTHSDDTQSSTSLDNTYQLALDSSRTNSLYEPAPSPPSNTLLFAAYTILNGLTFVNVTKGFVWSIALTNMHFMGVKALVIPDGFVALSPARVILCALISWSVCCVGVILMAGMEVNIKQQVLFSVVAATGVAAVHFSGLSKLLNQVKCDANHDPRNVCLLFLV